MKYLPGWLCVGILFVEAAPLWAEQEVILKSGTSLIGTVSIEGTDVVVQITDKSMRVPLKDVASVGAVNAGHEDQGRRLLILALEAKLNDKSVKEVVALLAEARRLAPDDPCVLYWCASTLADAGHGTAARDVFEPKREAIAKVYPGMADALEKRIKLRIAMEKLPADLLQRIDSLNATAAKQTGLEEKRQLFAYFRLVDQNKQPIEQGSFRIESRGQDENLECFEDGYFLYVFNRYRGNRDEPCQLDVSEAGLESKTFPFSASNSRVANVGEFVVKRYDEQSKKPVRFRVITFNGEPIANAKITLQMPVRTGQSKDAISTTTGLDGTVEVGAFPAKYFYRVTADGYTYRSGELEVTAGGGEMSERELKLHRAIQANVRVAWLSTGNQDGSKTSGETKVQASGGASPNVNRYSPDSPPVWVRATQQQDQLQLQFTGPMYGGPNQPGADNWIGTIDAGAGASDSDRGRKAQEKFDAIDLNKIDEQKGKAKLRNFGNQPAGVAGSASIPADVGSVYIGKMAQRDMRTGRPIVVAFKAIVEEMSTDKPGQEK